MKKKEIEKWKYFDELPIKKKRYKSYKKGFHRSKYYKKLKSL